MSAAIPARLFKYFGPERLSFLEDGFVRYTQLGAFNDPFEGRPEITALATEGHVAELLDELRPGSLRDVYNERLTPIQQKELPFEQFSALVGSKLDAEQKNAISAVLSHKSRVVADLFLAFDRALGALCLCEVPDSLLMWAHYAQSHEGFVAEFDAHHAYFDQRLSEQDDFRFLRRVFYRERRASGMLSDFTADEMFLTKSTHWSYEREWRIIRSLTDAEKKIEGHRYPIGLFRIPYSVITGVTLGARMSRDSEARLRQALVADDKKHIVVRRAVPDERHFLLNLKNE